MTNILLLNVKIGGNQTKLWIGHYYGQPKEWFLVWAKNRDQAALLIDDTGDEPDLRSLREVREEGFIDLKVTINKNADGGEVEYRLSQIGDDEVERMEHNDNEVYIDLKHDKWLRRCVEEPFPVAKEKED